MVPLSLVLPGAQSLEGPWDLARLTSLPLLQVKTANCATLPPANHIFS